MTTPFTRILLPYDGSEPANAAMTYAIALSRAGAALDVVYVVDERPLIAESTTSVVAFDPTPLIEALTAQAEAIVDAAQRRCHDAGVTTSSTIVHELPVAGIVRTAERNRDELIVLGTHARTGVPRAFLGSTTEGVLRSGTTRSSPCGRGCRSRPEHRSCGRCSSPSMTPIRPMPPSRWRRASDESSVPRACCARYSILARRTTKH